MSSTVVTLSLVAAVGLVGAFAFFSGNSTGAPPVTAAPVAAPSATVMADLGSDPMFPDLPSEHSEHAEHTEHSQHSHGTTAALPNGTESAELTAPDEPPAIAWKAPAGWKTAPNPSALRIATYKVARAPSDTEDADVSVVRAGGTADANIERWRDQFEGSVKETRTVKTVRGLKVTLVEISGTYLGGAGGAVTSRQGWTLVAAIVETPQLPYFFKLTGGTTTVRGARPAFDALVESISGS